MYKLKEAKPTDSLLIQKLAQEIFPHTYKEIITQEQIDYMMDMMYTPSLLEEKIETQSERFFIGYKEDTPFGYLSFEKKDSNYFYIQKIYVLPQFQGAKCGTFLFEEAKKIIKKECPSPIRIGLNMNKENEKALSFYKKRGMKIAGTRVHPIGHDFFMDDYILEIEI